MNKKFFSTVAGAAILISVLGIIARGFGFLREVIYAGFFGLNQDFESFLVGYVLPVTINTAIIYLGQNYFIPEYTNYKMKFPEKAEVFFNKNIWLFFLSGLVISFCLFIFSDLIINNYLSSSTAQLRRTALNVFKVFVLTIPLNAVFSILSAYLHTELKFLYPAVAQLLLNICVIIFVILFTPLWDIYSIPFGFFAGSLIQLFVLLWILRRNLSADFKDIFKDFFSYTFIGSSLIIVVLIELINQLHAVVDRYFIGSVDAGGIAALNYAVTIFLLPITIFSLALSSAIFPQMTFYYAEKKMDELNCQLLKALRINAFVFLPVSFILIFSGNLVIQVFYQRGHFNEYATGLTSLLLQIFSVSLLFYSAFTITNKLIFTTGMIRKLLAISAGGFFLKIVLNILLVPVYRQNGLALATSVCYILMSTAAYLIVIKKINFRYTWALIKIMIFDLLNAVISFSVAMVFLKNFMCYSVFSSIIMLSIFLIVFVINSVILKTEEIDILKNIFKQFIK